MNELTTVMVLLSFVATLCSCNDRGLNEELEANEQRYATLDAVNLDSVPVLRDFRALFPESTIQYLSFAGADFPSLSADTNLHERYTLNLRVPVFYSADNKSVLRYGNPAFFLCEISSIKLKGETMRSYDAGDQQWHFGMDVWKGVFDAKGDFGAVGYPLKRDAPVENFDTLIASIEEKARSVEIQAEQAGTGQPATRSQSKSEGSDKPLPEAEGRSQ